MHATQRNKNAMVKSAIVILVLDSKTNYVKLLGVGLRCMVILCVYTAAVVLSILYHDTDIFNKLVQVAILPMWAIATLSVLLVFIELATSVVIVDIDFTIETANGVAISRSLTGTTTLQKIPHHKVSVLPYYFGFSIVDISNANNIYLFDKLILSPSASDAIKQAVLEISGAADVAGKAKEEQHR